MDTLPNPKNLKEAKEQILFLKEKLKKYDTNNTLKNLYLSVKKKCDQISSLLYETEINESSLEDGKDKYLDRVILFMKNTKDFSETLVYLKEQLDPKDVTAIEQEDGSFFEEMFKEINED